MTLAIFDIDGTLVHGSTERRFWRWLLRRGLQGPRQAFAYVWFLVRFLPRYGVQIARKNKAYLSGLSTEAVSELAVAFVTEEVLHRLYAPALQRLQQHLRCGDTVVLLSGTLEPIARALADRLGVERVCATICAQRDGRFLAKPPLVHPFGQTKLEVAAELATVLRADLGQASAYGDSKHDLALLKAVGEPIAVLPDPRLTLVAQTHDWEIIADSDARGVVPR